jgi:hypothetical protein
VPYVAAILDACVIYPAAVRDLLLRLSLAGLFHARWTTRIHDEWMGSLLADRPDLAREMLERTRDLMDQAIADCLVTLDANIPDYGLPDSDDDHVLAAAIAGEASFIITYNLTDFPEAVLQSHGVSVRHPDDFVCDLLAAHPSVVVATARCHRLALRNPPKTVDEYLQTLADHHLEKTVSELRKASDRL